MTSITAGTVPPDTRNPARTWRGGWTRDALATVRRQGAKAVSTVRHLDRSPVLTATGLACIDISAWETFGRGAAWATAGISVLLFDWHRDR